MNAKVTAYNIFNDGNKMIGQGNVELPELSKITTENKGAGILGKSKQALVGHFDEMTTKIEFTRLDESLLTLTGKEEISLTFKANVQDGGKQRALKVRVKGVVTKTNIGKLEMTEDLGQSLEIETTYIKIVVDGKEQFELDKFNYVYKVDGKDLLADIKKNIGE